MPKWEYRIERIDIAGDYLIREGYYPSGDPWAEDAIPAQWESINSLGAQGWEMVSASFQGDEGIAVFKRELKEFRPKLEVPPVEETELTEEGEPAKARAGLDRMV
jgi:hypothetical protein